MHAIPALGLVLGSLAAMVSPAAIAAQAAASPPPFASYPWPGTCVAAARRVVVGLTYGQPFDTLPYDEHRRVLPRARATAAECLTTLSPGGVRVPAAPLRDIPALFFLGRILSEDTLADKAFRRFLGSERNLDDSIQVVWYGMQAYTGGLPRNPEVSARMALWLDTLGVVGHRPYLPDDSAWSSQHASPGWLASARLDTAVMRREIGLQRKNYADLPPAARTGTAGMLIGVQSQELVLALLQHPRSDSLVRALKAKAVELYGPHQERSQFGAGLQYLGETFPELHPEFWFRRPVGPVPLPRRGHVTMIQYVDPAGGGNDNLVATAHRLKARFGDALDLVLLAQTHGHFDGRVQLDPAEEAAMLSRRILEEWKVDAVVGVYRTEIVPLPAPDNRLMQQPIDELGQIMYGGGALTVDPRGILILADAIGLYSGSERALERLIPKLLEAPEE
jgi:hypothetical protein